MHEVLALQNFNNEVSCNRSSIVNHESDESFYVGENEDLLLFGRGEIKYQAAATSHTVRKT